MNRSSLSGIAVLLVLALLPILGFAAAPAPKGPRAPMARVPIRTPAMADTVFATVYGGKDVTWTGFQKGCRKLGVSPQSLTPDERRQVLDVLIDQSILTARATRDARDWTARDSAEYLALRDKLLLSTALATALYEQASPYFERGDTVPDSRTLGMMARDSAMVRLHPRYDDVALRHLAAAFSALPRVGVDLNAAQKMAAMAMLPVVAAADSARTLVWCDADTMTVTEALRHYSRLNPTYRPRIDDEDGVKDLVGNIVFNNQLRLQAEAAGLDRKPSNAAQLSEKAEFLDMQRFVAKQVYAKIALDSATLRRHYAKHPTWFRSNATADLVRMVFDTRDEAAIWGQQLLIPGRAESLATQSARARVPYAAKLAEDADSALFKRVRKAGVGAIVGPDSTSQGWRVMKIMSLELDHRMTFEEGYEAVKQDWYERDGERRMRAVLQELRTHTLIVVNEKSAYLRRPAPGARR